MNSLQEELEADLGVNAQLLDIHNDPFFEYFSVNENIARQKHVNEAVLLFNKALNLLDQTPNETNREPHVLAGDYLFSRFYILLSSNEEYEVLGDMMNISRALSSRKSEIALSCKNPDPQEIKYLLYAPLLYLIKHKYTGVRLESLIEQQMEQLDITTLPYITQR
ncbi:hypothetical protein [Salinicoccus albus]|uniref:hypothetical protein n=1 Tax=Salinicoccus albus TaxID=418756 RepID=UPI0003731A11|nr:hypothetical protein [Salinicoccus albus]